MSIQQVINNLNAIKKAIPRIEEEFISRSLDWIANKANENLDKRTNHFWGSDARLWAKNIKPSLGYGILENLDMNSAAIEFGIGKVGEIVKHVESQKNGYQYNKPSEYKDELGNWTFKDEKTGLWVRNFGGYVGKSFLYDAFTEYMQTNVYLEIYQTTFDEIIRSVIY